MIAKINLTLEQDEQRGTNEAMQEAIDLLAMIETMPIMKVVVTIECEEIAAEQYRQKLRYDLKRRPIGIVAKIKTTSEEQIIVVPQSTPMDKHFGDLAGGVTSVGLSHNGRSVTLDATTAANAAAMLRNSGELFED